MDLLYFMMWRKSVPIEASFLPTPGLLEHFSSIYRDENIAYRACFLFTAHEAVASSGLYNPFEPFAHTIEAPHPYDSKEACDRFARLASSWNLKTHVDPNEAGLTVFSPSLLYSHVAPDLLSSITSGQIREDQDVLCDRNYGIILFQRDDAPMQLHLVSNVWKRVLSDSMENNPGLVAQYRQGATIAAQILGDRFPEIRTSYLREAIPQLTVSTQDEYRSLINILAGIAEAAPAFQLWYRGQTHDWPVRGRNELASRYIVPFCTTMDSSLIPSLYRGIDDRFAVYGDYGNLILEIGEWLNRASAVLGPEFSMRRTQDPPPDTWPSVPDMGWSSHVRIEGVPGSPPIEFNKYWNFGARQLQEGIVLQHYGFPTGWLDITQDPEIALWFATRVCSFDKGWMSFRPHDWNDQAKEQWPTVYVFPLITNVHPFLDSLSIIQGVPAERIRRQKCGLLGGAGGLARNYAARFLGLKIRLAPSLVYRGDLTQTYLFPDGDEDLVLRSLLRKEQNRVPGLPQAKYPVTRLIH